MRGSAQGFTTSTQIRTTWKLGSRVARRVASPRSRGTGTEAGSPALAAGASAFTHLFNAVSPLGSREPGVVGAALSDPDSWCGLIVDGHHVDPVVLKIALACKRRDRFLLVTDAMPGVGSARDHFTLQGRRIAIRDGRCVDEQGVLTGSTLDMASAVRNCVAMLGLPLADAVRMASTWPAQFLGLGGTLGRIAPGYRSNLVLADAQVRVHATWIDGIRELSAASAAPDARKRRAWRMHPRTASTALRRRANRKRGRWKTGRLKQAA